MEMREVKLYPLDGLTNKEVETLLYSKVEEDKEELERIKREDQNAEINVKCKRHKHEDISEPCFGYCPYCGGRNTNSIGEPEWYFDSTIHTIKCEDCGKTYRKSFYLD